MGSSGDMQIVRDLLRNYVQTTDVLHLDVEQGRRAAEVLAQLPPHQIGRFGQLQE
jgi:alpha-L-fucosidase 2